MLPTASDKLLAGEGDPTSLFVRTFDHFCAAAAAGRLALRVPPVSTVPTPATRRSGLHHTPELFCQLSGANEFTTPARRFRLMAGQVGVIPALVHHREKAMRWAGGRYAAVVVMFRRDGISVHLARASADGAPVGVNARGYAPRKTAVLRALLTDVADAALRPGPAAAMTARGAMLAALGHIRDALDRPTPTAGNEHPKVALCRNIVMTHLSNPELNVRQLARRVGCSADYLSNLFRRHTGSRLTAWLNEQRIERAMRLLEESTLNISEIAWATGYHDGGYLARRFKAATGMTPKEYRREHAHGRPADGAS